LLRVRCIQSTPIGPIGAETNIPIASPLNIMYRINSIFCQKQFQKQR
jgi:hypothetical protein